MSILHETLDKIKDKSISYHLVPAHFEQSVVETSQLPPPCFRSITNSFLEGACCDAYNLSLNHGRSCIAYFKGDFYSLKGTGWNIGSIAIHTSPKDPRLVFGLMGSIEAEREYSVSIQLQKAGMLHGQVVAYCSIEDQALKAYCFKDGTPVRPAILYTKVKCPLRIKDLAWIDTSERCDLLCHLFPFNLSLESAYKGFVRQLMSSVLLLHDHGGVNDSLHYDNVTLACEIVDLEWLYYPGIKLPDGSTNINLIERQQKEILYVMEICQNLGHMIGLRRDFEAIFHLLTENISFETQVRRSHLRYLHQLCKNSLVSGK